MQYAKTQKAGESMILNSPAYTSSLNEVQLHHRDGIFYCSFCLSLST